MMCRHLLILLFRTPALTSAQPVNAPYGLDVRESELRFVFGVHSLGVDLELGRRGPADYARAAETYRKAAVLGLALSQYNLGRLYETGRGVRQDPVIAHMWYTLAAQSGDELLRENLDKFARGLSAEQLAQANALASDLKKHLPGRHRLDD